MRIGIRVADGSFFPILEDTDAGHKKLVVTTVRDHQTAVRLAFYRQDSGQAENAYLGTLSLEEIEAAPKGEPDVEVHLGLDDNSLNAMARDVLTGDTQSLSVSLDPDQDQFDIPEFDFDADQSASGTALAPPDGDLGDLGDFEDQDFDVESAQVAVKTPTDQMPADLPEGEFPADGFDEEEDLADEGAASLTGATYPLGAQDAEGTHPERRKRSRALLVGFVTLGLVVIVAVAYLIYRAIAGPSLPPLTADALAAMHGAQAATAATAGASEPAQISETPPAQPPVSSPPPATAVVVQPTAPAGTVRGLWYTLRWGDTLWDLAATFYRNPWLYPILASANDIPNPDLIYAGARLFVPDWE